MTANDDLSRRLSDHYNVEATLRAPDWLLEDALAIIETTPQRRVVIRVPWTHSSPITSAKLAAAVAVYRLRYGRASDLLSRFVPRGRLRLLRPVFRQARARLPRLL